MKKAFRKSLKRQASIGYFSNNLRSQDIKFGDNSPKTSGATPILWQTLAQKYQFNYPKDWYRIEAHWLDQIESFQEQPIDCPGRDGKMNNAITRISQCNESYQLCNSLPRSFIVPKDLKDFTLMNSMSTVIKDHRVPIISYCCPIEYRRNFIIRCASSDQQARVIDTLARIVKPLKVFNLTLTAPSLESVESAHKKLRDVCRPSSDNQALNFISKSGKWLSIISQALKLVKKTAKILLTEASVILIEDDDRGWNSVVSSLVQILLEPHRRTVEGLESLISKEWIYLSGGQIDHSRPDILFTLFLDCIYQIYLQNVSEFEFTSEYLRYLFESQYPNVSAPTTTTPIINKNHNNNYYSQRTSSVMSKNKTTTYTNDDEGDILESEPATYKSSSISMVDLNFPLNNNKNKNNNNNNNNNNNDNISSGEKNNSTMGMDELERGYNIFMFNPFYNPDKDSPTVEVLDHIANIKLWSSLYLRWQPRIRYGCIEETFYFQLYPQQIELNSLKSD